MLCGSFSKTVAPGYRVGWVAPGRFREKVELLKFALNIGTPTLPQLAMARYLRTGGYDRHLKTIRDALAGIEARTAAAIGESFPAGTRVSSPKGGCFLWVEMPDAVDAMELHARALDAGVSHLARPALLRGGRAPELHPHRVRRAVERADRRSGAPRRKARDPARRGRTAGALTARRPTSNRPVPGSRESGARRARARAGEESA